MKRIFKLNIKKIIASLTATSLLISFVVGPTAASALNSDKNEEYKQIFKEFILPYSYGKITNAHYAGTDRVIINIQDLHCHPKVQKNISNIIESFDKKFGVNKIYLEGAYGKVNTSWINDKTNNNKETLEKMLDTGRLTGAEYYSSLSGKTEIIEGLEEKEPYLDNIKRLGNILQEQENIDLILQSLDESVNNVKKKYYTKRQYKLEQLFNQYKQGKITSQRYYTLLSKHIDKLGIDLTKYENSLIYLTLLDLQKQLNYKKVTAELQSLISLLKQQVPYSVYKELLENTSNFQESEKLYSYIIQLDKIYNFDISSNYKELDKYFRYIELSKKINPVELVKEDEFLLQEINTRFSQTKAQKGVVFLVHFEKYLKDFLAAKITLDDYQYYKENIDKYITIYNKYVDNRVLSLLNDYIAQTDKFYNINMDRNTYFAQNMFNKNETSNKLKSEITTAKDDVNKIMDNIKNVKKIDVVITGGFHSQTVTEMIKNHDVSYIVITPNVYDGIKLAEDTYYELAKEQSKISFQTIAPLVASLSPELQSLLLEKIGNVKNTEEIMSFDDTKRAKIISDIVAANLLESDDTGNVEEKLQEIIKAVVDDLHKAKVTPELVSKIKNLQSLLKDKQALQKTIDLLDAGTAKQSLIAVSSMFDNVSSILDSFVSFANRTLAKQKRAASVKEFYIPSDISTTKKTYYDASVKESVETNKNIVEFFALLEKQEYKEKLLERIKSIIGDTFEIKDVEVKIDSSQYYFTDFIKLFVTDKNTGRKYELTIKENSNLGLIDFSAEIKGYGDRDNYLSLVDTLVQAITSGTINSNIREPKKTGTTFKDYYDEGEQRIAEISRAINSFFFLIGMKENETTILDRMKKVIGSQFEIKNVNVKIIDHPYYPDRSVNFTLADNQTKQEYNLSVEYFGNSGYDELRVKIEGDADRTKLVPIADELAQNMMTGSFIEGFVQTTKAIEKQEVTKEEIKKLKREIIKKGKNHRDIVDFIKYLNRHKLTDYELLSKILNEFNKLEEWEIPEYCSIIYILKTKENILSFFEMPELLQLKFCDFYTSALTNYNEDLSKDFFEVLLEVVNTGKYTEKDFDFLFDVLLNSRFIAELGTKENIYEFLTLDIKKRKQIYNFYKTYDDDFNVDTNRLSLNFVLYIANKYTKISAEQFNYLMKVICMSNLANFDSIDRRYIEDLKGKGINPFILETFQNVNSYNRYLLDLLFSDIDEKYIDVFESKLQRIIDLFDSLKQYEISNLETENKSLALIVFLSDDFEKYCKYNDITDIVKQYQLAVRVARRIFTLSGKNIFDVSKQRLGKIVKATLSYYEKIDEISSRFNVFTDKTAVFSLYNSERNFDGTQRFTPAGLKELFGILDINPEVCCFIEISFIDTVLDFINSMDEQYLDKKQILDFIDQTDGSIVVKETLKKHIKTIKGTTISKDNLVKYIERIKQQQIENEIENYLGMIENFKKFELQYGTFLFDGHGLKDSFFYSQTGKITVERLVKALVAAHNNGVNLENITLMFSSCNSYDFASKIITGLIDNRIYVYPQIIMDAGKETALAYDTQIETSSGERRVSNLFYSLLMSLKSKTAAEIRQMKGRLTFKEVADVPRYLSNNTIFMTNQQVEDLNHELEETIHQIIEEFDSEGEERFYPVMEDGKYVGSYNPYVELMLSSTKQILNKIGNNKIIKSIYKERAGENFKNTKFGVAIGVLLETFAFWLPNFVSKHEFDPSQESGVRAVVWKIRALSIGIGIIPAILSLLNPVSAAFILPAILLTENISHYIYNTRNSKISVRFNDEEKPVVVLVEKDGNRYSLIFKPAFGSIYLGSINENAYSSQTTAYDTPESIEQLLGIKINISKHRLSVRSNDTGTNIKAVKYSDVLKKATSLVTQALPLPEQKEIDLVKNDAGCTSVEYVYLDRADWDNRAVIKDALENNKLLVFYPFSKTCDIDSLTDEELFSLYLQISTNFINMLREVLPSYPKLRESDFYGMEYLLLELVKNAFVHGNLADLSKPIYIHCAQDKFTVYNAYNQTQTTNKRRLSFAAMSALSGAHKGMEIMQGYEDEGLITVTSQQERIRQIGDNPNDKFYAVTVEKAESKPVQIIKDVEQYLRINGVKITQARFEEVIEYLKANNYEITDQTYEYIRYLLYVSHIDYVDMRFFNSKLVSKFFDLSNSSKDFLFNFINQNEKALKGNQEIFDILINITKEYDSGKLTEQNFKEILNLIILLADRIGKGTRKDVHLTEIIQNNKISDFFLQYYLENKDTFDNEEYRTLIAYLIFSEGMGLEYYANQSYTGNLSFDSEFKNLLADMVEHQIYDLNMFYNGLTLKIYFNKKFKELLEKEYDKNGDELTPLIRYRTALVIAENLATLSGEKINSLTEADINKIIEECVQDIINKKGLLKQRFMFSEETDFEGDDTDTAETTLKEGTDFEVNRDKASNTALVGLSNSEKIEGNLRRFSLNGIRKILEFTKITPRLVMDLEVVGARDAETKIKKMLKMIAEYPLLKNKYGLKNMTVVINGHGDDFNIYLDKSGTLVTRTQIAQALFEAYKNGANLEEITLDLSCCASYAFCENLFDTLRYMEERENLEIKLPNIITEAGKEIKPGFTKRIEFHQTKQIIYLGNSTVAILLHIIDKIKKGKTVANYLTLDDVFDSEMYNSNHTIFISGQDVAKTNAEFREKLTELLGQGLVEEGKTEADLGTAQLQLPFTQKVLNKIGNSGIIKSIYKEKSGDNFRFTKLGVAIGVLLETIAFWMPNFVKAHNFDPSIQTKMTAVVWVIRALSIGLGFGVGSIWALLLTETITHFIWNITVRLTGRQDLLLQISQEKSQIEKTTTQEQQSVSQQKWTMSNISKEAPYTEKYKLVYYIFEKTCRQMDIEFPEEQEFIIINNIIDAYDSSFWEIMDFENWVYEHFITDIIDFQQKQSRLTDALSKCFPDDIEDILWIFSQCLSKSKVPMFILNNIIDVANDLEKTNNIHFSEEVYAVLNILKRYNTSETEQILVNIGLIKVPNALYKKAMDDIEFKQLEEEIIENENGKMIVISELQLPFTQKVLNKIGNNGIIKSVYKEKAGEKFRFTKLGVAIGVLLETLSFWMPNFVKTHNFDPSIQTKMTAVVWVIRALSIGLGFGLGSIWALLLTETIAHFIWNINSPSNLMLQIPESSLNVGDIINYFEGNFIDVNEDTYKQIPFLLTKFNSLPDSYGKDMIIKQLSLKFFELKEENRESIISLFEKETSVEGSTLREILYFVEELERLNLNKKEIYELLKLFLNHDNVSKIMAASKTSKFYETVKSLKRTNFELDENTYQQIIFLNPPLTFFDLKPESRQTILDMLKNINFRNLFFNRIVDCVKELENRNFSSKEISAILQILDNQKTAIDISDILRNSQKTELLFKLARLVTENNIDINNIDFNQEGYMYVRLISSALSSGADTDINTDDVKIKELFDLISNLASLNIETLDIEYKNLTLKIFLNEKFRNIVATQYRMEATEGTGEKLTNVNMYRIAQKISRTLYEIMGDNVSMLTEQDLNAIMEIMVNDNARKRAVAKKTELVSENTGTIAIHNMELDEQGSRRFTISGIKKVMSMLGITPKLLTDIVIEDKYDIKNKTVKWLSSIEVFSDILELNGLTNIRYVFNGHGNANGLYLTGNGMDNSAEFTDDHMTVKDIAEALFKAYRNCIEEGKGEKIENLILDLSCCHSYEFAKKVINELKQMEEQAGLPLRFPQIITEAGKEITFGYFVDAMDLDGEILSFSNMEAALMLYIEEAVFSGKRLSSITLQDLFDAQMYMSNHTIFISNSEIEQLNETLKEKLTGVLREGLISEKVAKREAEGETLPTRVSELQLPFTQKVLNKIGNLGIIKSIYKEKAGNKFRFTKLGVAIGVLLETLSFWMPNFVKAHNFDPSIQARMTAVVWVIRALSIGLGFGIGSVWALLLTETIAHFIWNISVTSLGKQNLLLQTSENLTKEQKIQKIFEVSKMETDFEEEDEERQEINSLLNKVEISEADIDFVLQKADFFANDSLYNYYKLKFFFSVIGVLREKNIDINNGIYEQIMLLMSVFTYEQPAFLPGDDPYKIVTQPDEGDTEEKVLKFFNLKSENRQQIYNKLNGVETLGAFELMIKSVEECEQAGCTEQEIDELLTLINNSRKVMEEYYFRDFEKGFFNIRNLRFYIDQKNKLISRRNFINFFTIENTAKSPLWLSLIYSTVNINSVVGNSNTKISRLIKLIEKLEDAKIRMLDTEYNGLTLRIFLNEEFRNRLKELEGKNEEPTIFDMYRTAQKISRTLYEVMGDNVFMLSEQDLNDVMETMIADNLARRSVAKNIEIVSENTGTIAIHNIELDKYGSRRFSIRGIEKIMSLLGITPKLVTDFVIADKNDVRNKLGKWLESIENFLDILEQNGLTNIRYVFDGHGSSNGLHLTTATSDDLSAKKVAETLFAAYEKCVEQSKGEKFENLILDLSSCSSYEFARKVIDELKQLEEQAGLPLRFPQIITEAGKETEVGYSVTYSAERFLVSNMEASLIVYIRKALSEGRSLSSITLQDLFDAQIFMSNHTMFVSSSEIETLNEKLREDLKRILRKGFVPEKEAETDRDQEALPARVAELQLSSTQKMLEKIGNLGIIKAVYKDKAGKNFRYTKLGVAIGTIVELFSFWSPNFIKSHDFDPSIQTRMTAVVWVIRALSIGLGLGAGVAFAVSFGPLAFLFGIPALFLTETITHFIWNVFVVKIEKKAILSQTSKQSLNISEKNKHSVKRTVIRLVSIFLTAFMLMLGGYAISSSVENTDVINIQQITDIFNNTLESKEDYQKLIDELGVNGINQLLNSVKNENEREELRSQFARYIKDSQYVELLSQSVEDGNYKVFFEIFDPTYNKIIKGNLGNMRAGAKEYEALMENLGAEGIIKIIESIDDEQIKTAVVNDIIKSKYDYFLADALSKDKLDLFFDTLDPNYNHLMSMNETEVNCLLLNYFNTFSDLEVLLDYFDKNNKSEITNTLINKYNSEIMNMYYVELYCKAIKEGKKEEFLNLFKDKEAKVRSDIEGNTKEYLNDLLAAVRGKEVKAFLELFSEDGLNNLTLKDYDRLIGVLNITEADNLLNSIENEQLKEKIRQDFQDNITDNRYFSLLTEAGTDNNSGTLFKIYDPDFEHLQSFSEEQIQGLISKLETTGVNNLLNGINNVNVKENMRQTFEKAITSEQYEEILINSLKSNNFKIFFEIFDPNCANLRNVRFKYQSLLVSNKTEVDKFLSYVESIDRSSYYFLNNNFNKAQNVLNYINQNSDNEALKEYKDKYIYLDLSLDELKEYEQFYNYAKSMKFVNKEISFDDIINQITSEGNGKLVFQVLADSNFNKLYDNYNEKYQAAIAVTEYINSYCESYGIEDTGVISDYDMKQIIKFVSAAYKNYIEENMSKTVIDSNTQVVSIVGDNERSGEFVVRDLIDVLDYIKQNKNKRSFFAFDSDADCEQLKTDFLNKLISLSEQNPNQRILINIHAHGYPGGFVVGDSVRITTEELTDTLIQMHNNGVDLSNVTIAFNSCNTYFSSTEIFNRLKEANIENLPVIYAEAGFETKLGFSKGSVYGEETYLYTTLLSNLRTNNSKKVIVSDFYDVQPGITWANPTLFVQIDNDSFDKLDKQLSAVISKYSTNTVDVSETDKNIENMEELENPEDLSPEDIEFLTGNSNYSNTAFPTNIFAYSIFNKEQNAELNEKASIWEEIVFRAVPSIVAAIYDKEGGQESFSAYQEAFIYAHALSRWITNDGNVREKMSFGELVDATMQEMSKGTEVLAGIYEDAIKSAQNMSSGEARKAIIDATLQAIGLHQAYNSGLISREEFESGQYDDNIIRQMLSYMGVTYELVENLINQSLFLLGYSNENVKQKLLDMSVVYNALLVYDIISEQVRKTIDNEHPALQQNETTVNYDRNDFVTVLLIKKADGTQYSVRLALNRIKEGETDYIRTGVPDRKMFVYLSSLNDDAFSTATSKYTTLEYIERVTGVKIEVTDKTIVARSTDSDTQVSLLRSKDVRQIVSSLVKKPIPAIDQQQQADVENITQAKVTETIYLDESPKEIERKLEQAIKNNSLIVIYPFSHTYDMDSLTDDQIYSLYFDIQNKFFDLQEMLDKYLPEIDARRGMAYILKEFIKNAFVHGNISDPSQPIYIKFIGNGFTVINIEGKAKDESTKQNRINLSAAATLTGAHRGLQIIRDYEEQGLIRLEQEIEPGKAEGANYYIVTAERIYEQDQDRNKIDFNNLIERVFAIIDLIERINNKYPEDRAKSMTEAEQILTDTFTPEELEIIDLLASTIFDSIKYVNSTRNTSAVEFVNIIYSLQNGLFNDNLLTAEGDLRQHILDMLKHYVEVSKQKKGEENILVKAVNDNKNILDDMADFLTDIIVKKKLVQKAKQQREQRRRNLGKFIEGVQKDDSEFSAVMICSANENRSAIWHIMFEDFLRRTKRKLTKVFSAGVFYDISQEVIRQTGKARVLRDDYHDTLSTDERYRGVDEGIKSGFRSTYIKYLKVPKGSQKVFIVAGEQHRAQLIKLGYDPAWIFLMSEFYSDSFISAFKNAHKVLGKELEENNIFSMSEYPDPFEEQILRQDLPELTKSLVEYVFKTRDDFIRETLPERFVQFTDDYNQFEHMDNLPSFAFTDNERREATRELYEDEVSDMVRAKYQFEFAANTKYLYILQNRKNKEALLNVLLRTDAELKFKFFALMYLSSMGREITQQEQNAINAEKEKMLVELKNQLETNSFKILNNFDLRAYMMGIYLMLQGYSAKSTVPDIVYKAFIINKDGKVLANSDGYFAGADLFTIIHELTHVIVGKPGLYNQLAAETIDELVSYITPNMFLSVVKLSLKAYSQLQSSYTIHQTDGVIDYVKMGKKLHVLYNLFSERVGARDLKQEEHSAPIAFLDLLFNAHRRIGKNVDWTELMETIRMIDDPDLDQSYMFFTIANEYAERLEAKDILSQQEAKNLLKEMEKMQLWTMLSFDIIQNIKATDPETYNKILGTKSAALFEEQLLSKPAETKEQLKQVANAIKSKEQLTRNDILTLLIIDVISTVDYEQLINNFDGVIEGITNTVRIAAQMFDMQKSTYSLSEYEQISKYVSDNYTVTQNSKVSVIDNIFDFISNSLDQLFFAKLLISKVFGIKDITSVLSDKKLLIVTSKQQEETLQQVLQNNGIEDIKVVTMEIITEPTEGIRRDMVLDVQKGIKARYEDNKLIIYSKQGITISTEEIQSLIMQEYFAERSEDVISEDVIAFAAATDTTLDDITNRLKTAYTASVSMPNKETKFDLSSRTITSLATVCKQEFAATGIKTFVITSGQAKTFTDEIKTLREQDFRFVISCKSDNVADITDYDGLVIDATAIPNISQAVKFMESLKKKVLKQGLAKQISVKFSDEVYKQFETVSVDIFNSTGIMPVVNADKIWNIGKCEVENITENNIEQLLRSNNVTGLVIDNARVFAGKKSIIKQLFSKEHKYNKGYNASLSSKFDYVCYDLTKLKDILTIDINNDKQLQMLKDIDLSALNLSADSLTYLEYLKSKEKYEEMAGFIRGIAMNSARAQIINALKEKGIDLDIERFAKEANGKYQKVFLTVAVQLMMEGIDITKYLETDFIDSNMTTKQYLNSVFEKVNINIEDILKQNEYKIERTQDTAKTIEDFKNYVVLLDNLRIIKEATANFDMSMKAVRGILAAA